MVRNPARIILAGAAALLLTGLAAIPATAEQHDAVSNSAVPAAGTSAAPDPNAPKRGEVHGVQRDFTVSTEETDRFRAGRARTGGPEKPGKVSILETIHPAQGTRFKPVTGAAGSY